MTAGAERPDKMRMNTITKYFLFIISTSILLLDALTPVAIDNSKIYLTLFFISVSTFILIIANHFFKSKSKSLVAISISLAGLLCFIKYSFAWSGDWKTQTIIYQNLHLGNRTIEFQMRDIGALGYKKRPIDRIKIIPFIDWINEISIEKIDTLTWKKVDIDINSFELKGG